MQRGVIAGPSPTITNEETLPSPRLDPPGVYYKVFIEEQICTSLILIDSSPLPPFPEMTGITQIVKVFFPYIRLTSQISVCRIDTSKFVSGDLKETGGFSSDVNLLLLASSESYLHFYENNA